MVSFPTGEGIIANLPTSKSLPLSQFQVSIQRLDTDPVFFGDINYLSAITNSVYRTVRDSDDVELSKGDLTTDPFTVTQIPGITDPLPIRTVVAKYGKNFYTTFSTHKSSGTDVFVAQVTNTNTVLSEAAANALTGIAIDGPNKKITVTTAHSWQDVYDFTQAWLATTGGTNLEHGDPVSTSDGTNYILASGWKLVLGVDLTTVLNLTGSVVIDAVFDVSDLNVVGPVDFTNAGTYDFTDSTIDEVTNSSGGAVVINSIGSTFTTNTGPDITINNNVTITIKAVTSTSTAIENARVSIESNGGALASSLATTITRVGTTATATATAHGMKSGDVAIVRGADQAEYTGAHTITVVDANTYTYTVSGSPATPATGTVTTTTQILTGLTNASGILTSSAFNYSSDQPIAGRIRKGSVSPRFKTSQLSGTITSAGFSTTITMVSDE